MATPAQTMRARLLLILALLAATALQAAAPQRSSPTATVLCYHVVESPRDTMFAVDRNVFLQQIEYLASTGYNVIPLSMLADYVAGRRDSLPEHAVVITIDDGWRCTYTEIYPVLKRYHLPFTVFIYPKFIGQSSYALTWKQVREMAEAGVDVQSHTLSHPFLTHRRHHEFDTGAYNQWLQAELTQSRETIEKETGKPVRYLAYPYGDYDTTVATAAATSGYSAALTCDYGQVKKGSDPYRMRRVMVFGKTSFASFREHLGTAPLSLAAETPQPGKALDPSQQPVISARIANLESVDPGSVGMSVLSLGKTSSFFDRRNGTVSMTLPEVLKGNRQRAVVWARDKKSGKRLEATWSFFLSEPPAPAVVVPLPDVTDVRKGGAGVTAPPILLPGTGEPQPATEPVTAPALPDPARPADATQQNEQPSPSRRGAHR